MSVELTKLLFDYKNHPTGKSSRNPEREAAKIFIKKFGKYVKSKAETINFFVDNYLANNETEAKTAIQEMTKKDFQYRIEIPFTLTHFSLAEVQNNNGQTGYKIIKFGRD